MIGFIDSAKVYLPNGTDGAFTVLATTLTSCRLTVSAVTVPFGGARVELTPVPRLLYTDNYVMPGQAQIEVNGARYNVKAGTFNPVRGPSGAVFYRRVDVEAV